MIGALIKPVSVYYTNPIKSSYAKFVTEKGVKNKLINAFQLSVDATNPYIGLASSLGKTPFTKATYGVAAGIIPVKDDIAEAYNKIKKAREERLNQQQIQIPNEMQNFGMTGAIGGTILGGALMGTPGAVIGGVAGDMWQNKRQKQKEKAKNIMNEYLNPEEITIENIINKYMD